MPQMERVSRIESTATGGNEPAFIMIIEKDATFRDIFALCDKYPCILVTVCTGRR